MRSLVALIAAFSCSFLCGTRIRAADLPPGDQELIMTLIEALDDPDIEVRHNIALALANLGEAASPRLLDALDHPKPERRMGAAMALGQMRPANIGAVPALLRAVKDTDNGVRRQVSYALSRIVNRECLTVPPMNMRPSSVPPPEPTPGLPSARGSR